VKHNEKGAPENPKELILKALYASGFSKDARTANLASFTPSHQNFWLD
jgi:hypothetical protein